MLILELRHYLQSRYPGLQLHCCGAPYLKPDITPVKNSESWAENIKPEPETGLWTSPWREELQGSTWTNYAQRWEQNHYWGMEMMERDRYLLTPREDVYLCVISTSYEFGRLLHDYPYITARAQYHGLSKLTITELGDSNRSNEFPNGIIRYQGVDFEKLSKTYDGLWLTQQGLDFMGQWRGQVPMGTPEMTGWSCESIVWFRWCFSHVLLQKERVKYYA